MAAVNAAVAVEHNEYLESILPPTVADFVRLVETHLHKGTGSTVFCLAPSILPLLTILFHPPVGMHFL